MARMLVVVVADPEDGQEDAVMRALRAAPWVRAATAHEEGDLYDTAEEAVALADN